MQRKTILYSIIVLSIIGFFVATYLTLVHYKGELPKCSISGCEVVSTSEYAVQFGVPIALFGAAYFLSIIILSVLVLQNSKNRIFDILLGTLIGLGAITSCVLLFIQFFVLGAICIYCVASDSISIILLFLYFYKNKLL